MQNAQQAIDFLVDALKNGPIEVRDDMNLAELYTLIQRECERRARAR